MTWTTGSFSGFSVAFQEDSEDFQDLHELLDELQEVSRYFTELHTGFVGCQAFQKVLFWGVVCSEVSFGVS